MVRRIGAVVALAMLLFGCGGMTISDFEGKEPKLAIEEYFLGETRAWGLFEPRFGGEQRRFTVDIDGRMEGGELVLDERFRFDDGETDRRVWRIRATGPGTYEGRADDVIGVARGEAAGNALRWRYTLALETGDRVWNVDFDDWMFLMDDRVLMNKARVTKFGVTVGHVTLFFQRAEEERRAALAAE